MTQAQLAWYREMERARRARADHIARDARRASGASRRGDGTEASPIGYVRSLEGADSIVTTRPPASRRRERACARSGRRTTDRAPTRRARTRPAASATADASSCGRCASSASSSTRRTCATTASGRRSTSSTGRSGRATTTAARSCRTTASSRTSMIRALVARGAVIGVALDAWMIVPGWVRGQSTPESAGVTLDRLVDHIDHICQIAGNARPRGHRQRPRRRVRPRADGRRTCRRLPTWRRFPIGCGLAATRRADVAAIAHGTSCDSCGSTCRSEGGGSCRAFGANARQGRNRR